MRGFTAVFLREIEEHYLVFLIGGFLALVSLLAPLLSNTNASAQDVREVTAMAVALAYVLILSVGLGLTGIASELGSGQHSFFFSRPVGAGALLSAKLAAALVLVAGGGLLAAAPAANRLAEFASDSGMTFYTKGGLSVSGATLIAAPTIGAILLILGSAHFLSLAFRARDAWLAVDLIWLAILAALGFWAHSQLSAGFASGLWLWILIPSIALLIPAVIVAWLLQVVRGRTDLARGHRWMSAVLGCLALAIGSWLAYSAYRGARPEPADVWALDEVKAGSGEWLYVKGNTGPMFGYRPSFFWNLTSGSYVRMNSARAMTFNKDRSKAVWLGRSDPRTQDRDLYWIDLTDTDPKPVRSSPTISIPSMSLSLSPSGEDAALWNADQLLVIDVASGAPILTPKTEEGLLLGVVFPDRQTLQLLRVKSDGANEYVFVVDTIDLETAGTTSTVTEPLPHSDGFRWSRGFRWFPEEQRLTAGSVLVDLSTGKVVADLRAGDSTEKAKRYVYEFLSDGRIIGYDRFGEISTLRLYDRNGKSQLKFDLGPAQYLVAGGQPSRNELLVATNTRGDRSPHSWITYVLDLRDGTSRELGFLAPISRPQEQPGTRSTALFTDTSDSLWALEADGSFRQLTRGRVSTRAWPGPGIPRKMF